MNELEKCIKTQTHIQFLNAKEPNMEDVCVRVCVFELNVRYISMDYAINSPKRQISKTFIFIEFTMAIMRNKL
jgi:hypothetical protein